MLRTIFNRKASKNIANFCAGCIFHFPWHNEIVVTRQPELKGGDYDV